MWSARHKIIWALFTLIILEGYVVLSSELLAIRQTIPFIGSGTDTVSIIIAAVLMPLAFGYYAGGRFRPGWYGGRLVGIRQKLLSNMLISMVILLPGLSYIPLAHIFFGAGELGLSNRILLTSLYSLLFLVTPVYLLGQTIPLVSNYFGRERLPEVTGRILFFSTIGSFMGAVFSTLILMAFIGVNNTAALVLVILAALIVLLSRKKFSEQVITACALAVLAIGINSDYVLGKFNIVENNKYNTIIVQQDDEGAMHMIMNNESSSMVDAEGKPHAYIRFMEDRYITPLKDSERVLDILVIGAGGFTLGLEDTKNKYDFIDIDGSLKKVSEEFFLKRKLTENKNFKPLPARAFLASNEKTYDLIVLDAYLGGLSIPEHLVTREFFAKVKNTLKPEGVIVANFIVSPNFRTQFSINIDNTLREVFGNITRNIVTEYDGWSDDPDKTANVVYVYHAPPRDPGDKIYTDNRNTIFFDKNKALKSAR